MILPFWVFSGEFEAYAAKLPSYRFWLGAASILHLVTVAAWVLIGERSES